MIKLKQLYFDLLKEQNVDLSQPQPQLQTQSQNDNVFELPQHNIVVSQFEAQKKLTLSALDKDKPAYKIRQLVNQLKNEFNVKNVSQKGTDLFEVTLDPREDFFSVIDFLKQQQ